MWISYKLIMTIIIKIDERRAFRVPVVIVTFNLTYDLKKKSNEQNKVKIIIVC